MGDYISVKEILMQWQAYIMRYKKESRIAVKFENNRTYIERFKKLEGARWSSKHRVWHLPDNDAYRIQFGIPLNKILDKEHLEKIESFRKCCLNSTYKKLAVQWLNEVLCFVSSSVLADSLVLRNRQLLVAANRCRQLPMTDRQ